MENTTPTNMQPDSNATDVQAQCLQLRKLVNSMLILMVVISGTLNILLVYQYRVSRGTLREVRAQVANMMAEYSQIGPRMDEFVNKIIQYGNTHKDFGPIMVKYNLMTNAVQIAPKTPAATPPAATPPAATTPKK